MGDTLTQDLPETISRVLADFVESAREAFGPDLISIVLFGSAAEGTLRPTSDVNVIVVLSAFDRARADKIRETLRVGYAAVRLSVMFLLQDEIQPAADAFSQKFADVRRRRRVLWGPDPFLSLEVSRDALVARLRQVLLNLIIRMRNLYISQSLREEQLAEALADVAGPLATCAVSLLELEGTPWTTPYDALSRVAATAPGDDWAGTLLQLATIRGGHPSPPGTPSQVLFRLLDLLGYMRTRVGVLR